MDIKCEEGYVLRKPNEKYKCDKVIIKGKKARKVAPEPQCIVATTTKAKPQTTKTTVTNKTTQQPGTWTPMTPYSHSGTGWWPKSKSEPCKQPVADGVTHQIVDDTYSDNRGYSYVVNVEVNNNKVQHPFTIVLEMDPNEQGGNFQMWNFQYFGFYPGYVTLHSKPGKNKAVIIGTNFSKHTLPNIYVVAGHDKMHECYRLQDQRSLAKVEYQNDWFEQLGDIEVVEDVMHVVYRAFDGRVGILN